MQRRVHPTWLLLIVLAGISVATCWWFLNPQARNRRAARSHILTLEPTVHTDPRFQHVKLGAYTGGDGSLWVHGVVLDPAHGSDLRRIIEGSSLPVRIWWTVEVSTSARSVRMHEFLDGDPATDDVERALAGGS
jgi:cbb3-type cytochrome oxidase subunit 3